MRISSKCLLLAVGALLFSSMFAFADDRAELKLNVKWSIFHEGCRVYASNDQIRVRLENGNYEGIRSVYHDKQNHNPNARNLLAAVNNLYIRDLVSSL